jgi:hypothetical protein
VYSGLRERRAIHQTTYRVARAYDLKRACELDLNEQARGGTVYFILHPIKLSILLSPVHNRKRIPASGRTSDWIKTTCRHQGRGKDGEIVYFASLRKDPLTKTSAQCWRVLRPSGFASCR